ncbi:hypothetical protein [Arthrobacter agilis]|uniref:hypothetical protein n=1 Tax=Arthrobacter agilis TaxID=37921 RepID=UPI002789EC25|nr:hypothetical protein [Arthrobacter agilis]MDQ0733910.1 hypothetical protein [Arthrobacter agilis]
MTQQGTGQSGPGRAGTGQGRPDGEAAASARLWLRLFLMTLLGSVLASNLVLPWKVLALVLALFALGAGVVALVKAIAAKLPRLVLVATSIGLAATLFLVTGTGASVLLWRVTQTYEDCMSQALTLDAQGQCEDGLRKLEGLGG